MSERERKRETMRHTHTYRENLNFELCIKHMVYVLWQRERKRLRDREMEIERG